MIISDNPKPVLSEFKELMRKTDSLLNHDAANRQEYYLKRGGKLLESDVYDAICESAKKTTFEGSIQLVSGASFPDIVAAKYYGVEVKSTEKNHWTSIGSSILESTRNLDVKRIYLTFGKLGRPVSFISRPYEECLSGIVVTHYPRYQIDMRLREGETIFDKMGIPYDTLRLMENPVTSVSQYYKKHLKPGESLWWAADNVDTAAPATVRLLSSLETEQKERLAVQGYALFPEILSASQKKYNRFAIWLATVQGIICTNVRDNFSAGGRVPLAGINGADILMPAAYGRIKKYAGYIEKYINETDTGVLEEYWEEKVKTNRIHQWCTLVATNADNKENLPIWQVLMNIFPNAKVSEFATNLRYLDNQDEDEGQRTEISHEIPLRVAEKTKKEENMISKLSNLNSGDQVCNQTYGIGVVLSVENGYVKVKFKEDEKEFSLPGAIINGYLEKM